jgi:hypothetical protein
MHKGPRCHDRPLGPSKTFQRDMPGHMTDHMFQGGICPIQHLRRSLSKGMKCEDPILYKRWSAAEGRHQNKSIRCPLINRDRGNVITGQI